MRAVRRKSEIIIIELFDQTNGRAVENRNAIKPEIRARGVADDVKNKSLADISSARLIVN